MSDDYCGDTVNKKFARLRAHIWALNVAGSKLMGSRPSLFLASEVAGDAKVTRAFGIPGNYVWLVERRRSAYEALILSIEDGEHLVHGDVEAFSFGKHAPRQFAHVFLDFCNPLDEATINAVYRVARNSLADGGVMTVGVMYGRTDLAFVDRAFGHILQRQREARAAQPNEHIEDLYELLDHRWFLRAEVLAHLLNEKCLQFSSGEKGAMYLGLQHALTYKSNATPMVVCTFKCCRMLPGEPRGRWTARRIAGYAPLIKTVEEARRRFKKVKRTEADLRRVALRYEEHFPGCGHLFFALPRATVVAWKAHATRGTYAAE